MRGFLCHPSAVQRMPELTRRSLPCLRIVRDWRTLGEAQSKELANRVFSGKYRLRSENLLHGLSVSLIAEIQMTKPKFCPSVCSLLFTSPLP